MNARGIQYDSFKGETLCSPKLYLQLRKFALYHI